VLVAVAAAGAALFLGSQAFTADDGGAIFGSRTVQVAEGHDRVEVGMLFGSVKVVVPDGVRVRQDGLVVFGSTECAEACRVTSGGREVVVDASGGFGSVEIYSSSEFARGVDLNDLDDRDEDDEDDD
jgi:N-methylhydantoinase A/oxoprolinase/acetone carboxylase beta subunit